MKIRGLLLICVFARAVLAADSALTIYNQNFAVIRDTVPLALHKGENRIAYSEITAHLEPESVILRDLSGRVPLRVIEQCYCADPVSSDMLLSLFEGTTIKLLVQRGEPGRNADLQSGAGWDRQVLLDSKAYHANSSKGP